LTVTVKGLAGMFNEFVSFRLAFALVLVQLTTRQPRAVPAKTRTAAIPKSRRRAWAGSRNDSDDLP
jgi:hypothetical protein